MDDLVERLQKREHHFRHAVEGEYDADLIMKARFALDDYAARITALEASLAEAEKWRVAVDDAIVTECIGTADTFPDAATAVAKLIEWVMSVAVDPAVSKPAADLVAEAEGRVIAEVVAWLEARSLRQDTVSSVLVLAEAATALENGEWKKDSQPPPTVV